MHSICILILRPSPLAQPPATGISQAGISGAGGGGQGEKSDEKVGVVCSQVFAVHSYHEEFKKKP
jgi:hypothetical protein